jgi:hypothetical protein
MPMRLSRHGTGTHSKALPVVLMPRASAHAEWGTGPSL